MTNDNNSGSSSPFGCVGTGLGLAALVGFFTLGPMDLARTSYNAVVGDIPPIREKVLTYCREGIKREKTGYSEAQVEAILANELNYDLNEGERINAQKVEMGDLWDSAEDHAPSFWQRWVWPDLK